MWQALCWLPAVSAGAICYRPGRIASRMVREVAHNFDDKLGYQFAYYTPVRLWR